MVGTDCTLVIRPKWNDPVVIKRILDIGAHRTVVPW
jgi:2-keto-3-deoxy-L-rhamnonate aldolase RhmA